MKNKQFADLAKRLLPDLPGFFVKGPLVAHQPVRHTLRGLYFDGSSFDATSFYVSAFFLPLFVPTKHVSLTFSTRLREEGGADRWNANEPDVFAKLKESVKRHALPFLAGLESAGDIIERAAAFQTLGNCHAQQTIAYAWALAGNLTRATEELERLAQMLDVKSPWQREMAERSEVLKRKLSTDRDDARRQLEAWELETVHNLGLKGFRG